MSNCQQCNHTVTKFDEDFHRTFYRNSNTHRGECVICTAKKNMCIDDLAEYAKRKRQRRYCANILISMLSIFVPFLYILYLINSYRLVASFELSGSPGYWDGDYEAEIKDKTIIVSKHYTGNTEGYAVLINIFLFLTCGFWFLPYWIFIKSKCKREYSDPIYKAFDAALKLNPKDDPFKKVK